jgi:hypothetical protein
LAGDLYWWSIKPLHGIVFGSMIKNLAAAASTDASPTPKGSTNG